MRNQQRKESLMILENQNYFKHVFPTELGILFLRLGKLNPLPPILSPAFLFLYSSFFISTRKSFLKV